MVMGRRVFVGSGDPGAVKQAIHALEPGRDDAVCVLVGERSPPDLNALVARLREAQYPFFGAIFPALIDGLTTHDSGVLAFAVPAALVLSWFASRQDKRR